MHFCLKLHFNIILQLATVVIIGAGLAGCRGIKAVHSVDNVEHNQMAQPDGKEILWRDNKNWLLSRLQKTGPLVQDIVSILKEIPDSKYSCVDPSIAGCEKLLDQLRQKMSYHRIVQLPDGSGSIALLDGDTAYVFRITDWTFSGIANLAASIYFTVPDVLLRRTDGRSFAYVADDKTDTETFWTIYHRNILANDRSTNSAGEYPLTRAELDAAGVPKQIDLLTQQQCEERELAKQGLSWRRRAQMQAIRICNSKPEPGSSSRKGDERGGRGKHNRNSSPESTSAGTTPIYAATMAEALQGKAHLNCNAGSGYFVTEDGIAAEVYRLIRSKEGIDAIISATAMEIPGGVIQYRYSVDRESNNILNPDAGKEMILQIKPMKGSNELTLRLQADTGVSAGFLILAGDWYLDPDYRIKDKKVSNYEFTTYFIRAYRECFMKGSQGNCLSIPDLFIGLQNSLMAKEYMQYISDHYLVGAEKVR